MYKEYKFVLRTNGLTPRRNAHIDKGERPFAVVVAERRHRWRRTPRSWWASIALWGKPPPGRRCAWSRHPIGHHRRPSWRRRTAATITTTTPSPRQTANPSAYCCPSKPADDPSCCSSSSNCGSNSCSSSNTASYTVATRHRSRSKIRRSSATGRFRLRRRRWQANARSSG